MTPLFNLVNNALSSLTQKGIYYCSLIQFISYNCITHKLQGFYIVIFSNEKILHYGSIVSTIGIRYLVRRIGFDFIILSFK